MSSYAELRVSEVPDLRRETGPQDVGSRLTAALEGRYRILRELGAGGMATVWLGWDLRHDRLVAIKVLKPEIALSLGPARFLREIHIAARLTHPNIVPVFDSGIADGLLFYVMPYLAGESLRERMRRPEGVTLDESLAMIREVADGLDFAHRAGVVHRDIKPSNILLSSGHAYIADFGIARSLAARRDGETTAAGVVVGSPSYMSPEQAAGDSRIDGRSDLYSLACVLYELLCGVPPFGEGDAATLLVRRLTGSPRPLRSFRPEIPPCIERTILRALSRRPKDRYETAAEFVRCLGKGSWYLWV